VWPYNNMALGQKKEQNSGLSFLKKLRGSPVVITGRRNSGSSKPDRGRTRFKKGRRRKGVRRSSYYIRVGRKREAKGPGFCVRKYFYQKLFKGRTT